MIATVKTKLKDVKEGQEFFVDGGVGPYKICSVSPRSDGSIHYITYRHTKVNNVQTAGPDFIVNVVTSKEDFTIRRDRDDTQGITHEIKNYKQFRGTLGQLSDQTLFKFLSNNESTDDLYMVVNVGDLLDIGDKNICAINLKTAELQEFFPSEKVAVYRAVEALAVERVTI